MGNAYCGVCGTIFVGYGFEQMHHHNCALSEGGRNEKIC